MVHTLPALGYAYDALEPHIDALTMKIHHTRHHQAYIDKLNSAIKGTEFEDLDIDELLKNISKVPEEIKKVVINHGGGHANHSLFWKVMGPDGEGTPFGALAEAIESEWRGFDKFKEEFSKAAMTRFGSGWAWLVVNTQGQLEIYSTPNQDSPLMKGEIPLLGLDVWEHAYYKKWGPDRPGYIKAWWNVVNWKEVARRYEDAH